MEPIIVSQDFSLSKKTVWNAITEHGQMVKWFFDNIPNFKAEVGYETQFNIVAPSRHFMHIWKVTEVIPEEKMVVQWTYEGLEGASYAHFELEEHRDGCNLKVRCTGLESFDQNIPEFARESCQGGWEYFINGNLVNYLS